MRRGSSGEQCEDSIEALPLHDPWCGALQSQSYFMGAKHTCMSRESTENDRRDAMAAQDIVVNHNRMVEALAEDSVGNSRRLVEALVEITHRSWPRRYEFCNLGVELGRKA